MKATAIELRKMYEVTVGRGTTIVKVMAINSKTGAWICETQGGKDITISDAKRFLKAIDDGTGKKKAKPRKGDDKPKQPKPEPEPETATSPNVEPVADAETLERLRKAVKDADKKLRTAHNALRYGFIEQSTLDATIAEHDAACKALKDAGGVLGSGGKCLGQMSGKDAAYKVLCETGKSMNGRQICEMALDKGYWEPQGETPEATIVSAILTEIKKKGDAARFIRTGKGLFAARENYQPTAFHEPDNRPLLGTCQYDNQISTKGNNHER